MVTVDNALYVKGGWDKQGICVACRARYMLSSDEPLCDFCKKNGIGCVKRFPRFYYKHDWRPPGFRGRNGLDPLSACKPCQSTKTKCDQVEPCCSCCRERGVECVYGGARDEVRATAVGSSGGEQDQSTSSASIVQNTTGPYVFPCAESWPCTGNAVCYYCREKKSQEIPASELVKELPMTEDESSANEADSKEKYEQVVEALNIRVDGWELVDRDEIEEEMKEDAK